MRVIESSGSALHESLAIRPGMTAFVGGGGKTTAMLAIAHTLCASGRVLVTTSTHIFPPENMTVLHAPTVSDIQRALRSTSCLCIGIPEESGKLTRPAIPFSELRTLFDYVLVEADGAKHMPLKAPAAHEPVIPEGTDAVVAVAGLDGIGRPIQEAAFRAERYAEILQVDTSHVVAPLDAAKVLCSAQGQYKNVYAPMRFSILLNKADDAARVALAYAVTSALDPLRVACVVIASLKERNDTSIDSRSR